jgi:PIN domain nuclease of toxin-antitoxin system
MNLLLDTHALLWWKAGSRKLGPAARRAIERGAAGVHVSAVSAWEIAVKSRLGRLRLAEPLHRWMPASLERDGFSPLAVTVEHAVAVASLPDHHDDPFDRLLIAQAREEGFTILTADDAFGDYDVRLLDAAS